MVKAEVIKKRLEKIYVCLVKIQKYQHLSWDEFLQNDVAQDVVEYNLFNVINMMTDIALHIVADNRLGNADSMTEAFEILYNHKYISKNDLKTYKNMIGLRNILAHEYVNLDKKIIYDVMKK
ncbi:DUF86 domain-containing protein [Thermosyntropha sp.]|uniref:type VII toxin-antitoxin system HepT family RNase toxin n=1 Tax=Thermosyntropha sp. TaxID=2740820 RepID=UPI0025ED06FE|nr:DUF86 domain-containing protein [Thermosyntropha sp.]